jgi:hypothetical protein
MKTVNMMTAYFSDHMNIPEPSSIDFRSAGAIGTVVVREAFVANPDKARKALEEECMV